MSFCTMFIICVFQDKKVRDDPKLQGDSGEVLISEWSGWQIDSCCEIFNLLTR